MHRAFGAAPGRTQERSHEQTLRSRHRHRRRAGRAVPVARAGAAGHPGLSDRSARRRQFSRTGAARRHQPSRDARTVRRASGFTSKLEPRGIIAPLFHYWDRHESKLIAEFDHAHLKDDTRFPYVLQCERIKIVEEALKLAKAHPADRRCGCRPRSRRSSRAPTASRRTSPIRPARRETIDAARYIVSGEGARSIVRKDLDIEFEGFTYPDRTLEHRGRLRFPQARLYRAQLHLRSRRVVEPVPLEGAARPLARPFPDRAGRGRERRCSGRKHCRRGCSASCRSASDFDIVGSNLYTVHQRVAKKFRAGRAILAGDSAHVNSPIGAMGMNSGIHDAFNLADKLVSILRREADDERSRPLRAPAPPRRVAAHAGPDHPQQAGAGGEGPGRAPEEPRRVAPHRRRPQACARVPAAQRR